MAHDINRKNQHPVGIAVCSSLKAGGIDGSLVARLKAKIAAKKKEMQKNLREQ